MLEQSLIKQVLVKRAGWLDRMGDPMMHLEAEWLRSFAGRMGDLGEEQEEIEILPLHEPFEVPETVPAEPEKVPA